MLPPNIWTPSFTPARRVDARPDLSNTVPEVLRKKTRYSMRKNAPELNPWSFKKKRQAHEIHIAESFLSYTNPVKTLTSPPPSHIITTNLLNLHRRLPHCLVLSRFQLKSCMPVFLCILHFCPYQPPWLYYPKINNCRGTQIMCLSPNTFALPHDASSFSSIYILHNNLPTKVQSMILH
jgi:hypothetical protein